MLNFLELQQQCYNCTHVVGGTLLGISLELHSLTRVLGLHYLELVVVML